MSIKLQVPLSGASKVPNFEEDRKQMLIKVERGFRYKGKTQRREVSVQDYMAVVKYISKRSRGYMAPDLSLPPAPRGISINCSAIFSYGATRSSPGCQGSNRCSTLFY